jgi:pimeloyl-ACP methyl ester carboxylesterase
MNTNNTPQPKLSDFAEVNGTKLYYEVYGTGEPLFLLHGFTQSSVAWKSFVAEYAKDFEVYLVDLRGHGKSEIFNEKFSVAQSAEDLLALLQQLKLKKIKAIGMSFGGDILLQVGTINPGILESIIVIAANADWNAQDYPEMLKTYTFDKVDQFQWIYDFHTGGDTQIRTITEELANYKIKLSDDQIKKIKSKTLLLVGDSDGQISLKSMLRLYNLISDSQFWVVPDTAHYAHDGDNKNEFLRISKSFLSS